MLIKNRTKGFLRIESTAGQRCARKGGSYGNKILYKNLKFFDKIFVRKSCHRRFRNAPYGEKILLVGKSYVWA